MVVIENSTKEEQFLPASVEKLIKDGNFNQIPFMAGYVPQEAALLYYWGFGAKNGSDLLKENLIPENSNLDLDSDEAKKINDKIKHLYFKNKNNAEEILEGYLNVSTLIFLLTIKINKTFIMLIRLFLSRYTRINKFTFSLNSFFFSNSQIVLNFCFS